LSLASPTLLFRCFDASLCHAYFYALLDLAVFLQLLCCALFGSIHRTFRRIFHLLVFHILCSLKYIVYGVTTSKRLSCLFLYPLFGYIFFEYSLFLLFNSLRL